MFEKIINEKNKVKYCTEYIKNAGKPVAIYGAGYSATEAIDVLTQAGVIIKYICDDDANKIGKTLNGIIIRSIKEISKDEELFIIIASGYIDNMRNNLKIYGLENKYIDVDFGRYDAEKENYEYFSYKKKEIEKAYNLMADEKSKQVFVKMINYRISRERNSILDIVDNNQYFESSIVKLTDEEVYVDLGAFDGDTIEGFCKAVNDKYKKIIALEPSIRNYKLLCANMNKKQNVECYNYGAYSSTKTLRFEVPDSKNSFISEDGNMELKVVALDDLIGGGINNKITFIKMDIEGAEVEAIKGVEGIIKDSLPTLAICVYHKVDDLFEIPLLIDRLSQGRYCYCLRHYAPSSVETVLYCLRKI